MKQLLFIFMFFGLGPVSSLYGQQKEADLLWSKFKNEKLIDSIRYKAIDKLIWGHLLFTNPDSALVLAEEHYRFAEKKKNKMQMAYALNSQSVANKFLGNQLNSIAKIKASLNLHREIGNEKGMAACMLNLGNHYLDNEDFLIARDLYEQSLDLQIRLKNITAEALCLNNIGLTYYNLKEYDEAKNKFEKSILKYRASPDTTQIFFPINNLGALYLDQNKLPAAERQFKEAKRICHSIGDKLNEAMSIIGLADTYRAMDKISLSISEGQKALKMYQELNALPQIRSAADGLHKTYLLNGDYKKALEMLSLTIEIAEKLNEEAVKQELLRQEYQYQYEKKSFADSLHNLQKEKFKQQKFDAKINQQKTIIWFSFAALLLVLFAVYNLVRSKRLERNVKKELVANHALISEQNKNMRDSIAYAKYLQTAILPPIKNIQKGFDDSFVLFQPKDVVSGDFYWYNDFGAARVLAVADCTGHGVPGALMSMMGYEVLNNVMSQKEVQSPASAIAELDEKIRLNLNKEGNTSELQDGMDITVLVYQPEINRVQLSGAGNPIVQIKNGELIIHKLDRYGVGGLKQVKKDFQLIEVDLEKNDSFYLFTDGFQDQFGGPKGKKLMRKKLYTLLLKNHHLPFEKQKEHLVREFKKWQGDLKQVDDICIIGIHFE